MKKLLAFVILMLVSVLSITSYASDDKKVIYFNGTALTENFVLVKDDVYMQTTTLDKMFNTKTKIDTKTKKAILSFNGKKIVLDYAVINKKYYTKLKNYLATVNYSLNKDLQHNEYFISKNISKAKMNEEFFQGIDTSNILKLKEYLAMGYDLNTELYGEKAISYAVNRDFIEVVRFLFEYGADPNTNQPATGNTLVMMAVTSKSTDMLRLILEYGADVNLLNNKWNHFGAVLLATKNDDIRKLELLLKNGGNPNAEHTNMDGNKTTALELAVTSIYSKGQVVKKPNFEIASLLIQHGADPKAGSALFWAVNSESYECTKLLLETGADANSKDMHGQSVLTVAKYIKKNNEIANLLIQYGAK